MAPRPLWTDHRVPPRRERSRSRRLARGSSTGARSGAYARRDQRSVRAGHHTSALCETALQSSPGPGAVRRTHDTGLGRAEGRPRAWRRARHPCDPRVVAEPAERQAPGREPGGRDLQRQREARGVSPGPQQPSLAEPGFRRPTSGTGRELRRASRPAGGRGADRHPRVSRRDPPGSRKESKPTTTSVRMEELSRPSPPPHTGRGAAAAAPVAEARPGPQPRSPGLARRAALVGGPRSRDQVPRQAERARARDARPGQARGAVRPDRRADPRLSGATDRDPPAPVGGNSVRCEQGAAARWARAGPFAVTRRGGIAWMATGSERERPPGQDHELPGPRRTEPRRPRGRPRRGEHSDAGRQRGCMHPRDGWQGPIPKRAREREQGAVAQRTRSGPQRQEGMRPR